MSTFREQVEAQAEEWAERHRAVGRHVSCATEQAWVEADACAAAQFVSGQTVRGFPHQCLYRAGELLFDPHPSRVGLVVAWRKHSGFDHDPASPIDDDEAREAFRALRGDLEEAS